jgi:hypothetical protein
MKNFQDFFNASKDNPSKERFTPNTRVHHQNAMRSVNRKHQNQVARSHGFERKKDDPIVDSIVKYNKKGSWVLSNVDANRILKTYGINHTPNKRYSKSINRTGIIINFNNSTNKFTLSRK